MSLRYSNNGIGRGNPSRLQSTFLALRSMIFSGQMVRAHTSALSKAVIQADGDDTLTMFSFCSQTKILQYFEKGVSGTSSSEGSVSMVRFPCCQGAFDTLLALSVAGY